MVETPKLAPLEDVMLDDAEQSLVTRPRNGLLDRIVANDLRRMGLAEADISAFFRYNVSPCPDSEVSLPSTPCGRKGHSNLLTLGSPALG